MKLIIIKLGGSVVTYKNSPVPKARISVIKRLAKEILQIYKQGYKIVLVHGGGSFGHPLAKKYQLQRGLTNRKSLLGFVKTANSMIKLNNLIVDELNSIELPAVAISPRSFITQKNRKIYKFNVQIIRKLLQKGLIPVTHGDGVIDQKLGVSILSGDSIATYLAKKMHANKLIFLSDVDGIFDRNPLSNKSAKLISSVNNNNLYQVINHIKRNNLNDITGEMQGKILSIKENLPRKRVFIVNGLIKGNLSKGVLQQNLGTELYFD